MTSLIEIYTNGISDSISEISESQLQKAMAAGVEILNGSATENDFSKFYEVAGAIVEPVIRDSEAADAYMAFMDNDSENWQSWSTQTFGDDWGFIVKVVAEYGY